MREKQPSVNTAICKMVSVITAAVVYHLPFIPHIRVVINQLHSMFNPCLAPAENQWQFERIKTMPDDIYYVVYYCIVYFLLIYAFPCFSIACKCKDIADFMFNMNNHRNLPVETINSSISAMMVLALSNTYLVFNTPKIVILLFRVFNYPLLFMKKSYSWFHLINLVANWFLILRPSIGVIILIRYNDRIRYTIVRYGCFGWKQIQRTRHSLRAFSKRRRVKLTETTMV